MNTLRRKLVIPTNLDEAWGFFSRAENLSEITPTDMKFTINSTVPDYIYPGLIIKYKVSPIFRIPLKWVTEITQVKIQEGFIDEQRYGPFRIWHHEHLFRKVDDGVEMQDILYYKLPLGILGNIIDRLFIARRVRAIFDYREMVLKERYGINMSI